VQRDRTKCAKDHHRRFARPLSAIRDVKSAFPHKCASRGLGALAGTRSGMVYLSGVFISHQEATCTCRGDGLELETRAAPGPHRWW
jgi:hypothetical protein